MGFTLFHRRLDEIAKASAAEKRHIPPMLRKPARKFIPPIARSAGKVKALLACERDRARSRPNVIDNPYPNFHGDPLAKVLGASANISK
jgi:hypothetical protein